MDSATLAAFAELGRAQRHTAYSEAASISLVAVEILHSLPEEVALIWKSEWNTGKILFLLSRYLVFFDASIALYYTSTANTVKLCEPLFAAGSSLTVVGVTLAEIILYLRVFALSGRSRWVAALLVTCFVGFHGTTFVFLARFIQSLEYAQSPIPTIVGCLPVKASAKDLSIVFVLIMASEIVILIITLWLIFSKFRQSKNRLVTLFYRDGLVYFVLLTAISAGNIICNLVAPPGYSYLLATPQRALHSILATRMVLHIRNVHGKTTNETSAIPLSDIGYAVRVNVRVDQDSVQFPRDAAYGEASTSYADEAETKGRRIQ
ncbi:hypothetical protein FA13DRAFT_1732855 [Coprinellus micaceus]|uniref:DUF6533 domain-containing protein n=1 Tax=Coprinellus micaceus TaxID=71717 RepID=A0A4Y7TB69_COPMI|nr:hypothetical protein FA13DRAFT_1732855 [Coprinellus micaceus]